jgi:hypothetical protein
MAFDLDNEELKATRKLHRLNDDLYGDKKIKNDKIIAHKFAVMQQQINEKDSRIQELEEELEKANKQLDLDYVDDNYIPKQKVKDKIEELKKEYYEILSEYGNLDTDIVINVPNKNVRKYIDELVIKILVLQELLEGGK